MRRFGIANRCRPQSMGGIAPINPIDILTLCEKLRWPCGFDAAVQVIIAMDDTWRDIQQDKQQNQAA